MGGERVWGRCAGGGSRGGAVAVVCSLGTTRISSFPATWKIRFVVFFFTWLKSVAGGLVKWRHLQLIIINQLTQ